MSETRQPADHANIRAAIGYYFDPVAADNCPPDTLLLLAAEIKALPCAGGECPGMPGVGPRLAGGALYCRRCWAVGMMDATNGR